MRKFSSSTLPTLKGHLDTSRELQDHLAVSNARDEAMGSSKAMDDSSFAQSNPATPGTAAAPQPARVGSNVSH